MGRALWEVGWPGLGADMCSVSSCSCQRISTQCLSEAVSCMLEPAPAQTCVMEPALAQTGNLQDLVDTVRAGDQAGSKSSAGTHSARLPAGRPQDAGSGCLQLLLRVAEAAEGCRGSALLASGASKCAPSRRIALIHVRPCC